MKPLREWYDERAWDSLSDALQGLPQKQAVRLRAALEALIDRRRNQLPMADGSWVSEGTLKDGTRFYAIKKLPIRCYCWVAGDTLCVSHFVEKKWPKLRASDVDRVQASWQRWRDDRVISET